VQGLDWLPSLRTAKRKEVEAPEEDEEVQALRTELEQAQTVKERFKSAALKIRKENAELRDIKCLLLYYIIFGVRRVLD